MEGFRVQTPLLILGDAPSSGTGLGRILRDLSIRIHANLSDRYEVATLGYGGFGDRKLPFMQYHIESMSDWFIPTIREVWEDFAGDRKGIILAIWDASRLGWFARPENPESGCPDPVLREWLKNPPFQKWTYSPMDGLGPNGELDYAIRECLLGFDRVVAYSKWAERMIRASMPAEGLTSIPHGIDTKVFHPSRPDRGIFHREMSFRGPELLPTEKLIGIVATNQARKDWGMAFQALAKLAKEMPIRVYIQTDILERYWSISSLAMNYGLVKQCIINIAQIPDDVLARIYSTCDLTLGIGPEGFGYPIFESLACGTPVLSGSYGGQSEWMHGCHTHSLVNPKAFRLEGVYSCERPVYDPQQWAYYAGKILRSGKTGESLLPRELDWENLWSERWEPWFRNGVPAEMTERQAMTCGD